MYIGAGVLPPHTSLPKQHCILGKAQVLEPDADMCSDLELPLTSLSPCLCLPNGLDNTHFMELEQGCKVTQVRLPGPCLAPSELSKEQF